MMSFCHMNVDLKPLFNAYLAHQDVLIPTLIAFLILSPSSLKYWLAVEASTDVPGTPTPAPVVTKPKVSKWKTAVSTVVPIICILALILAIWKGPPVVQYVLVYVLFSIPTWMATMLLFVRISGVFRPAIFRTRMGDAKAIPRSTSLKDPMSRKFVIFGLIPLAFFSTFFAFLGSKVPLIVASTAIIYVSSRTGSMKFSLRKYFICVFAFLGVCIGLVGVIFLIAMYFKKPSNTTEPESSSSSLDYSPALNQFIEWYMPAVHSAIPTVLVGACLRFDYHIHATATTNEEIAELESVSISELSGSENLVGVIGSTGVLVPHSLPRFSRIYYLTAITAWFFWQCAFLVGVTYTSVDAQTNYQYSSLSLITVMPMVCLSVLAVAFARGELKAMWKYEEVRKLEPVAVTVAPEPSVVEGDVKKVEETAAEEKNEVLIEV